MCVCVFDWNKLYHVNEQRHEFLKIITHFRDAINHWLCLILCSLFAMLNAQFFIWFVVIAIFLNNKLGSIQSTTVKCTLHTHTPTSTHKRTQILCSSFLIFWQAIQILIRNHWTRLLFSFQFYFFPFFMDFNLDEKHMCHWDSLNFILDNYYNPNDWMITTCEA